MKIDNFPSVSEFLKSFPVFLGNFLSLSPFLEGSERIPVKQNLLLTLCLDPLTALPHCYITPSSEMITKINPLLRLETFNPSPFLGPLNVLLMYPCIHCHNLFDLFLSLGFNSVAGLSPPAKIEPTGFLTVHAAHAIAKDPFLHPHPLLFSAELNQISEATLIK